MNHGFKQGLIGGVLVSVLAFTGLGWFAGFIFGASAAYLAAKTSEDYKQGVIAGLIVALAGGIVAAMAPSTLFQPGLTDRLKLGGIQAATSVLGTVLGLGINYLRQEVI